MAGMEREFENNMVELVERCPWMTDEDQWMMRRVLASHFGLAFDAWETVDLGQMAEDVQMLASRAEEEGDQRRAWAFTEWYNWVCAALRGEEYQGPEMPEELAALP
ncbi:MAG TPA: hypothetical protein VHE33_21450 [Acidobacteriaceae bacterium]|nr:hypothetical protein [Acidobacteriaceae bacterium]